MKILMIGPKISMKGGMATVIENYIKSDDWGEYQLKFISSATDGNIIKKYLYTAYKIIYTFFYLVFNKVDIFHIHIAQRGSFYRKSIYVNMAKLFNKKVVIHMHGSEFEIFYNEECNEKKKEYIRKNLNKADVVIALSDEWYNRIIRYCDTRVEVLYNSVSIPQENNYNAYSNILLILGRLGKRKGTYDILEIAGDIVNLYPNIKIYLCGDGDIEEVEKIINSKKLNNNIIIKGWIRDKEKEEILKSTLINLLPSYNEGMPMTILETMSYGIPNISTYVGGIPNVITNGENGFLINPGDKEKLKENIIHLLENDELRIKFSENSYSTINKKFSLSVHIKELKSIYKSIT